MKLMMIVFLLVLATLSLLGAGVVAKRRQSNHAVAIPLLLVFALLDSTTALILYFQQ